MEERLKGRPLPNISNMARHRYDDIAVFSKKLEASLGRLIFSVVISHPVGAGESISLVLVVDDFNNVVFNPQLEDLRMKASELAYSSTLPLKCDMMLASAFWDGYKARDEVMLHLAREGLVVYDRGFFLPLQDMLVTGKLRPSKESVKVYFVKAEQSMKSANQHVQRAIIDLYWAVTDSAHSAVMIAGLTPPSPNDLADTVKRELVVRNLVHPKCAEVVDRIHDIAKKVMHREVFEISGREFDSYLRDAEFFMKEMDEFVKDHVKGDSSSGVR